MGRRRRRPILGREFERPRSILLVEIGRWRGGGRRGRPRHRRSWLTLVYTWVVEIEAWPSISCTTRRSAPWSSRWVAQRVAQHVRRQSRCRAGRPGRPYCLITAHAAWRVSRPPRLFRNTASASSRRRHCAGASAAPGRRARTTRRAPRAARPPERHDALLRPLAEQPHEAAVEVDVAHRQPARLGDARPGARTAARAAPGRAAPPGRGRRRRRAAASTSASRSGLGIPAGTRTPSSSAVGSSARTPSVTRWRCSMRIAASWRATLEAAANPDARRAAT